jgi:hypothetical protein
MPKLPSTNRTPTETTAEQRKAGLDPEATQPTWKAPEPGSYEPPDKTGHHAHDGKRELHAQGDRPHYHDPDSNIVVFFDEFAEVKTEKPLERRGNGNAPVLARELDGMAGAAINTNLRVLAGLVEERHAETARHARKTADMDTIADGTALLAEAFTHLREVDRVPDELKRRFVDLARTWAPNGDGGS